MIYLFGSELKKKSVFFSLINIFGIGKFNSFLICKQLGFAKNYKIQHLSKQQINKIVQILSYLKLKISVNLKKFNILNQKNLISIKCYKGLRKIKGLPIRGQRTHTNSRTARKLINKNDFCLFNKKN